MPKIQKIGNSLWVSIPFQIARVKGWQKGEELIFNLDTRTGKVAVDGLKKVTY